MEWRRMRMTRPRWMGGGYFIPQIAEEQAVRMRNNGKGEEAERDVPRSEEGKDPEAVVLRPEN